MYNLLLNLCFIRLYEETIVTPFAQILHRLRNVRSQYVKLTEYVSFCSLFLLKKQTKCKMLLKRHRISA